jgi:alkylation response protein AidB-like acyl-CoA dehydrogenase
MTETLEQTEVDTSGELLLDADQELLRDNLAEIVGKEYSTAKVRATVTAAAGPDPTAWRRLAGEFGVLAAALPEECGGAGGDARTRAVVLTELGARLAPTPYFGTGVLFADAISLLADEATRTELLTAVAAGELLGAFAVAETSPEWTAPTVTAAQVGDGWQLTGTKSLVVDGIAAQQLVVTAAAPDGPGFFLVDAADSGVARTRLPASDLTRELAVVEFSGAAATRLETDDYAGVLAAIRDRAAIALSAEMLGGMRRATEVTVEYGKIRYQFGRPIGSFQAIKHRLADMYVRVELATATVRAATVPGQDAHALAVSAASTLAQLIDFYRQTGDDIIHIHGGIGYTWEHEAHLYYRRSISDGLLLGSRDGHLDRLADLLAI